jgi:hypothetical protein
MAVRIYGGNIQGKIQSKKMRSAHRDLVQEKKSKSKYGSAQSISKSRLDARKNKRKRN